MNTNYRPQLTEFRARWGYETAGLIIRAAIAEALTGKLRPELEVCVEEILEHLRAVMIEDDSVTQLESMKSAKALKDMTMAELASLEIG